ncbi:leupaxin-like [Watersipora subatra]|uniref:leupaxin-like n=1 Tax=Watersipora subatra TaxID=2589382 RepID=UPI00355BD2EF
MDSLDELLADLHSATNTIKSEQPMTSSNRSSSSSGSLPTQVYQVKLGSRDKHFSEGDQSYGSYPSPQAPYNSDNRLPPVQSQPPHYATIDSYHLTSSSQSRRESDRYSIDSGASGDGPPPPLPPPPSQDVLDEVSAGYATATESLYEPQNFSQTPLHPDQSANHNYSMGPPQPAPPLSGPSTLGANLTELDYLLQDLNSAQFINEMNKSASDNSVNRSQSPNNRIPPSTLPKPSSNCSPQPALHSGDGSVSFLETGHTSTATRELEDLMDSLSQFKVDVPPALEDDPAYAKVDKSVSNPSTPISPSKPSELENMLGNLESDMRGHGVSVSTKGLCGACAKPVVGQVITALARIWHPAHFCCTNCRLELGTKSFFERDDNPYCEQCYHKLFAPLCGRCNKHILDKCVTAMDMTWHMECFICSHCGRMLNDEGFHERNGQPYCRNDYFEMFAPKCGGCEQPIIEDFISTLNTHWHPQCFRCKECGVTLAGGSFFEHEGLPFCETHYYAKRGSLCAGCQKPITGRCITAMFRKFHPEHFTCAFCLKQLNKGTFKEQNDKPYCHPCFVKLFA